MTGKTGFLQELYRNKVLFLMVAPTLLYFAVFSYGPMVGVYYAFTRFDFEGGLFGSQFIGMDNFKFLYKSGILWKLTKNTVLYNLGFILIGNVMQIVCAIFLAQIPGKLFKKASQSLMFLPFFLSWVLVGAFVFNLFSDYGVVNSLLRSLGFQGYDFYLNSEPWKYIITFFSVWKGLGYGTIIYLAAIMSISEDYYEAAKIDGANIFQQIRSITLPLLMPTFILLILFSLGGILKGWTSSEVGGKIFAIPNTNPEYTPDGWVYREDWRKELGLAEFSDLSSIEAYLDAVKTQKKVTPINGAAFENVARLFRYWHDFQNIGVTDVIAATSYDNARDIQLVPFTAEYEEWVKRMKTWADQGYWNKNTLSSQQEAGDFIQTNQGAVYWRNPGGAGGFMNTLKSNGINMEVGYYPFTRFHNYVMPTNPMANGMAIPKAAVNAERSLMVLDKLRNDPKYFQLSTYGIEGRHWAFAEDPTKRVVPAPGIDTNEVPRYDIASWGWRNQPNILDEVGGWEGMVALNQEFEAIAKPDIFGQIYLDFETVKSELAAVNQVHEQYGKPLMLGLVKNVDESLQEYRDKLKAAGVDKLYDYIKAEAIKNFDEKGVQ